AAEKAQKEQAEAAAKAQAEAEAQQAAQAPAEVETAAANAGPETSATVLVTPTGSKYHARKCGNGTYTATTLADAQARGLTPCSKCY
ncbi:serine protease, partial [Staphylococcus aureus]|nr:serine protease [Staphylococcus aureus]